MTSIPRLGRESRSAFLSLFLFVCWPVSGAEIESQAQHFDSRGRAVTLCASGDEEFKKGTWEAGLLAGAGWGSRLLFSQSHHDWALGSVYAGWFFTDVVGGNHWYRGQGELIGQVFAGSQYYPDTAFVVAGGPLLRYNFATRTRLIPFVNLGAGAAGTDIRNGDLSTQFEFMLTGGGGVHWLINRGLALTAEFRYLHMSNAGLKSPNLGVDSNNLFLGLTWFF